MRYKNWQKSITNDMVLLQKRTPSAKIRSEEEMENILHRFKVIARKRQIELAKLDNEIPWEPYAILTYTLPKRRQHLLKVIFMYVHYFFIQLRP